MDARCTHHDTGADARQGIVVVSPEQLATLIERAVRRALDERPPVEAAEYLDSTEAGELLGVSSRSVARLAKSGELPHATVGRALRFRRSDLLAYLGRGA